MSSADVVPLFNFVCPYLQWISLKLVKTLDGLLAGTKFQRTVQQIDLGTCSLLVQKRHVITAAGFEY